MSFTDICVVLAAMPRSNTPMHLRLTGLTRSIKVPMPQRLGPIHPIFFLSYTGDRASVPCIISMDALQWLQIIDIEYPHCVR